MKEVRIKIVFLLLLSIFFSPCVQAFPYAQGKTFSMAEKKIFRRAENHYIYAEYDDAIPYYSTLLQSHPDDAKLNYQAGICYYYSTTSRPVSVVFLERALKFSNGDTVPDLAWHAGLAFLCVNRFTDAEKCFLTFKRIAGPKYNFDLLDRLLQNCKNGEAAWAHVAKVKIDNLGPNVNSIYPDYAPVLTRDKSMLLFTSKRKGTTGGKKDADGYYFEDVYSCKNICSGKWCEAQRYDTSFAGRTFNFFHLIFGKAENVSVINTNGHDGSIALSPDDTSLYIYRKNDIWQASWDGSKWQKPAKMDERIDASSSFEPSIFITHDGNTLYFVSDRSGGNGGKDIWYCTRTTGGKWSAPVNAGKNINTEWDEDAPYVTDDGNTLYFSSQGHNSMGGYDVFRCHKNNDGSWSEPENLGAPVNNGGDDVFYVPDEKNNRAWYATLNRNGKGDLDIYSISYFPEASPIAKLRIAAGTMSLDAKINIHISETSGGFDTTFSASPSDSILYAYKPGATYRISVNADGYLPFTDSIVFANRNAHEFCLQQLQLKQADDQSGRMAQRLDLENYYFNIDQALDSAVQADYADLPANRYAALNALSAPGGKVSDWSSNSIHDVQYNTAPSQQAVVLDTLYFDFDKATLRTDMLPVAKQIVDWLKAHPDQQIAVTGFADSKGSDDYNMKLSARRAVAVKNYFESSGINGKRIITAAEGETHAVAPNQNSDGSDNPAGRAMNRRVEIKIRE